VRELDQDQVTLLIHLDHTDGQVGPVLANGEEVSLDKKPLAVAPNVTNADTPFGLTHAWSHIFTEYGRHHFSPENRFIVSRHSARGWN
jgi:hypothetical protein